VNSLQSKSTVDWNDRVGLQNQWSNKDKGWQVEVEWKQTPRGAGVFAKQDIAAGATLRHGQCGLNQLQFQSAEEMAAFCQDSDGALKPALVAYLSDYFYGFNPNGSRAEENASSVMWYGIWVPGNGLNHSERPNTIYHASSDGGIAVGIDLAALTDVKKGDELLDDYRRHGQAPPWAKGFADKLGISMNFVGCNDFV
jgi:hypothetical protein